MKHETWTKDKAEIRFMPLTAVAFKWFRIGEVKITAADLFLVLGMGGDGCKYNENATAVTIFSFSKS